MNITRLDQYTLVIKSKTGTIAFDPSSKELAKGNYQVSVITRDLEPASRTLINQEEGYLVFGPGEYEVSGMAIAGWRVAMATVYVCEIEGLNICHLGTLTAKLPSAILEELGAIDLLILPLNGSKGLEPKVAVEVMNQLEPWIVIPLYDQESVLAKLAKEIGDESFAKESKLTISRATLPQETEIRVISS